jgi:hypothetical protein
MKVQHLLTTAIVANDRSAQYPVWQRRLTSAMQRVLLQQEGEGMKNAILRKQGPQVQQTP